MWYDLVVLAILGFFAIRGAMKGVIWQIAGIAGIVLCFAFAQTISNAVGPHINLEPPLNHWVVLFGSYLVFSFVAFGVARLLNDWIDKAKLKEYNQHLGAVFGLVKGIALSLVLTFLIVTFSQGARESIKHSRSGRYAAIIMDRLHPVLPNKVHDALDNYIHLLDAPDLDLRYSGDRHSRAPHHDETVPDADLGLPTAIGGSPQVELGQPERPGSTIRDPWAELRRSIGENAWQLLSRTLQQSDPATRSAIESQLGEILKQAPEARVPALKALIEQSGSASLERALADWLRSPEPGTQIPVTDSSATPAQREAVIREIATFFSSIPPVREGIERELMQTLEGVPDAVALRTLEDWRADLKKLSPDPDPGTSERSTLEQRLLRQLAAARIPISSLSPQLQQRLRSAQSPTGNPL